MDSISRVDDMVRQNNIKYMSRLLYYNSIERAKRLPIAVITI